LKERSDLIAWIRSEIVGPALPLHDPQIITFEQRAFVDTLHQRRGALAWQPDDTSGIQEVLYFDRESPHRKYGTGMLHPAGMDRETSADTIAAKASDTLGVDTDLEPDSGADTDGEDPEIAQSDERADGSDDFEVTSADIRFPSTIGISFCVECGSESALRISIPKSRRFAWQSAGEITALNGRYESCTRQSTSADGIQRENPMWRRLPAVGPDTSILIHCSQLSPGEVIRRPIEMPENSPVQLSLEIFPRAVRHHRGLMLVTVVLRNVSRARDNVSLHEQVLYQTYFDVTVERGAFNPYPESVRPFDQLDEEEQSLALLYRESATWGIGHGCAAGWDSGPGEVPSVLYADVMPAVELPSMTADITDASGQPLILSMRELAGLEEPGSKAWDSLSGLARAYEEWIDRQDSEVTILPEAFQSVAKRHIALCREALRRIEAGVALLRADSSVQRAFSLANRSMLLQQISTKQLQKRSLVWDNQSQAIFPAGDFISPLQLYETNQELPAIGKWRAFQIAFLLLSLSGVTGQATQQEREIVDLIWFPTGGGKTEAYLGVMAFYMFYQRLRRSDAAVLKADGTNVLMRYTLRMLTTQQFQRAASLICGMEVLRRKSIILGNAIPGDRFSLGLWIGRDGAPNTRKEAQTKLNEYRSDKTAGNPFVLTECPWCRSVIGRYEGKKPAGIKEKEWNIRRIRGIANDPSEGPLLHCPDPSCDFGVENPQLWLPVEVIDERIYERAPSLVIATADKFAIIAYRPAAGALFGRRVIDGEVAQTHLPPGLIIQDELHLISGPLGTMYGLYEGVIETLCSFSNGEQVVKPKLIASTATIRGAADQITALYARTNVESAGANFRLFPSPGLLMSDSFFGRYAVDVQGKHPGRLYLGIHANDYASVLTAQVRAFASALCRVYHLPADRRDPWWTLLVFYNSIRELSGARTLFDADIRSRVKFLFNRENFPPDARRTLKIVEELTSRLSQAEIVEMMDRLATRYEADKLVLDACLASSIIEVGVDIDRLSLMGVVGQPKTTAQYIQVTGRVGRRWWERPGLILMLYNPSKSRDRSHFEQFHSYHRRLYERVEPTSATPFALSAIQRAYPGALILWARQHHNGQVQSLQPYKSHLNTIDKILRERCNVVQSEDDRDRSLDEMERVKIELERKWNQNPQEWEHFPPAIDGEYLMLWPGQFSTPLQERRGVVVPSSMRQVDGSAELNITQAYSLTFED
jgi:hypothetical protein